MTDRQADDLIAVLKRIQWSVMLIQVVVVFYGVLGLLRMAK